VARILVQLKLRLLLGALRSTRAARVSFILSSLAALLVACGTFAELASLRHNAAAVDLTAVLFTTLAFGWLILPLLAFGLDSTLDPATLALYPVRTRPLMVGLLAASATGAWPLANLIGELGITVGLAHGPLAIVIAIIAAALQVLFCITLARCVTTAMAGLLRSRRGRDLAALAIIPIFGLYETFAQVLPRAVARHELTAASFAGVDAWLRWLPPGLAAHAVQDASAGRAGTAVARLLLLAAVIAVLCWLWSRALSRALVTADNSTQAAVVRSGGLPFGTGPFSTRPLRRRGQLAGTVAARFLVYQRRDPTSMVYWGITLVIMVVVSISALRGQHPVVGVLLSAGFGGAFTGMLRGDAFGMAGPAFYLEALALSGRRGLRAWLAGRDLAIALIAVPLVLVVPLVVAVISGQPENGLLAMAIGLSATGAGLGVSDVFSAALPYPVERRAGTPTPRQLDGYALPALGGRLGSLAAVAVAEIPAVVAVAATGSVTAAVRVPVLIAGGAIYGGLLAWAGVAIGASLAAVKLPELFQLASRSRL
jgi:ABC-2 type transport system permease protein